MIILILLLMSLPAWAFDIGPVTTTMESDTEFLTRTVINTSDKPKLYQVKAIKLTTPKIEGKELQIESGELLFSPKRFTLHSRGSQNVKFYYKGSKDDLERYYRITFTEFPAAQTSTPLNAKLSGSVELSLALQSILVVRPRQVNMKYLVDNISGSINNIGNTYFEFMVKDGCKQPESLVDSIFIMPGETYINKKIRSPENQKLIVYQNKFISVDDACKGN